MNGEIEPRIEQQIDPIQALFAAMRPVYDELKRHDLGGDGYLSFEIQMNGHDTAHETCTVYYGGQCSEIFRSTTLDGLREEIHRFDPEVIRAARIAHLEAELAKLKGVAA